MLLASQHKPKGLFGAYAPSGADMTPKIDPAQVMQRNMALGSVQQAMQPKKPGINWLGVLADAFAGAAGREGPYAASMMAQRQQQQQREQAWQDWRRKFDYEAQHPKPTNNDTVNDYDFIARTLGPAAANQYLRNMGDPIVTVPLPNGQIYTGPRSQMGNVMAGSAQGGSDEWGDPVDTIPGGVGGNTGGGFPVAKPTGFNSYKSGSYDPLEAAAGKEYGVPPAILQRLRVKGEKSNANQVSEVGARSVYQITPETRAGIMKLYGFDPWSSPANAARGAAIVARDMYRKFGNWNDAMTGYHGGNDTRNWGPRTRAYSKRTKM